MNKHPSKAMPDVLKETESFEEESSIFLPQEEQKNDKNRNSIDNDNEDIKNKSRKINRIRSEDDAESNEGNNSMIDDFEDNILVPLDDESVIDGELKSNIPSLCCAFLASLTTGGTTYAFGLYGATLKRTLHLSQSQLDTISTATFCAGLFSWVPGLIVDRFGTRFSLAAGGIISALSLIAYWAVARQFVIVEWIVMTLSFLGVVIFLSSALVTGSVFKIIVGTCGGGTKGTAVGIAKGYVGLGAGVYACLFEAIRTESESDLDFLPMAAFFSIFVVTIPSLLLMPSHHEFVSKSLTDHSMPLHFKTLYCSLIIMAAFVVTGSIISLFEEEPDAGKEKEIYDIQQMTMVEDEQIKNEFDGKAIGTNVNNLQKIYHYIPQYASAIFLVTVWVAPIIALLFLPRRTHRLLQPVVQEQDETADINDETEDHNETTMEQHNDDEIICEVESLIEGSNPSASSGESVRDHRDLNLLEMLQTPSAMLMLWTTTILVGAGTVETNNMGQMVESLQLPPKITPASLTFFSVAQAFARVCTGAVSEATLKWHVVASPRILFVEKGIPRPFFLILAGFTGFIAHGLLSIATDKFTFVMGSALSGFAFGMVWPLMVLICGEVFGSANVGANYMFFDGFTSAAGTLLLTKIIAQDVYEDNMQAWVTTETTIGGSIDTEITVGSIDDHTCIGAACFHMTHVIVSLLSLTCMVTSYGLMRASRDIYNKYSM